MNDHHVDDERSEEVRGPLELRKQLRSAAVFPIIRLVSEAL
jgi:hypothetical protein